MEPETMTSLTAFENYMFECGFRAHLEHTPKEEVFSYTRNVFRELGGNGGLIKMHEESKPGFSRYQVLEPKTLNYLKAFVNSLLLDVAMFITTRLSPKVGLIMTAKIMHHWKRVHPKFITKTVTWSEEHKWKVFVVVDGKNYPLQKRLVLAHLENVGFDCFKSQYSKGSPVYDVHQNNYGGSQDV